MRLIILLTLIVTAAACSLVKKPAAAPTSATGHSAATLDEAKLYNLLGTIKPAQDEYNDKKMKDNIVPAFSLAVTSYLKARDQWIVYRQAVSLNTQTDYAQRQFEAALDAAVLDVAAMQRLRGINP